MSAILLGKGDRDVLLLSRYANRHGLVAGATGTGKSVSLMVMAEGFSRLGVPVFLADVKGDLAGMCQPGSAGTKITARLDKLGIKDWSPQANPVVFWDLYAGKGHPVRATISEMGPTLLARVLDLNEVQEGVLQVGFKAADENGLLLLDLDDLRALLNFLSANSKQISAQYGLVSPQSIAAIQRAVLQLDSDGGARFFGEPALDLADFMRQDMTGRGIVNILCAEQLILKPRLYSTFLLWLLSELFETLPEVGDLEQPKLVFFFDEAHLLFDDAPAPLRQRVEQVVRLIRSKGVGVYFISQLPDDVPNNVLAQLSNRVQHALRAFTPRDQKAVKTAAETFPPNPTFKVVDAITQLGVGEALVTTLQEGGIPMPVERTYMVPPHCRIGTISDDERAVVRQRSPVGGKYDVAVNRESAHEKLAQRAAAAAAVSNNTTAPPPRTTPTLDASGGAWATLRGWLLGTSRRQGALESMTKQTMRTIGSQVGRQILRGILGGATRR